MSLEKELQQVKGFRNDYHKAAVNLIFTGKWVTHLHSEIFKHYHLTMQQFNILRILRGQYPMGITVKLIRERMLDRMSDTSRIVELLREKKLVDRTISESDRRKMDVVITEEGRRLLKEIDDKENEGMDKAMHNLNESEIVQLNYLLDKLR